MRYHRHALIWTAWIAIAASYPAAAQAPGVLGIYNPATGQFQPVPMQMSTPSSSTDSPTPAATVSRSGKFVFTVNITVKSAIDSSALPNCYANVYHYPSDHSYSENGQASGTHTGTTATCKVVIPYAWSQADSTQVVNMSVTVYLGTRSAGRGLMSIPLPANGATTGVGVPVTM